MNLLPAQTLTGVDRIHHVDALTLLRSLADESVDLVLTDPPYGQTSVKWDKRVDFLDEIFRVVKQKRAVVVTAIMPYVAQLIVQYQKHYRYDWIWHKSLATGHLDCSWKPLRDHEYVLVFSKEGKPAYYPQMTDGDAYSKKRSGNAALYSQHTQRTVTVSDGERYPRSVQFFRSANTGSNTNSSVHPTQKPVDMFEYFVNTYSRPNEIVLDPFVGSGTTALAAFKTGRRFICGDQSAEYVSIARERVAEARLQGVQLPMFAA